jgi:RimJ/RimL family protein N-acetyltransferase
MSDADDVVAMDVIGTARLTLEPLLVSHADAMFEVLRDPSLYRYLDSKPHATVEHTRDVYARLIERRSPDGTERWLNWIVVPHGSGPVGFVQATIRTAGTAWIAYLLAPAVQGRGYASEAVAAMQAYLVERHGIDRFLACVEPGNRASIALLERRGLRAADAAEAAEHRLDPVDILYAG